jgi:hypothetical protein
MASPVTITHGDPLALTDLGGVVTATAKGGDDFAVATVDRRPAAATLDGWRGGGDARRFPVVFSVDAGDAASTTVSDYPATRRGGEAVFTAAAPKAGTRLAHASLRGSLVARDRNAEAASLAASISGNGIGTGVASAGSSSADSDTGGGSSADRAGAAVSGLAPCTGSAAAAGVPFGALAVIGSGHATATRALEIMSTEAPTFGIVSGAPAVCGSRAEVGPFIAATAHFRLPAPVVPSGTVAFVTTDIESSSKLWSWNPAAMRRAMKEHDRILRSTIAAHRGYEIKTEGDAFFIAFKHPLVAVKFSVQARLALLAADWPKLLVDSEIAPTEVGSDGTIFHRGLRVRFAIDYGPALQSTNPATGRTLCVRLFFFLNLNLFHFFYCGVESREGFSPLLLKPYAWSFFDEGNGKILLKTVLQ